ncbi:MAG: hypothetical protein PVI90_03865, partial [Desulfobacteraceae bacterium]
HFLALDAKSKYNIFDMMFRVKGIKEKLVFPPIVVNNAKWRTDDEGRENRKTVTGNEVSSDSIVEIKISKEQSKEHTLEENSIEISTNQKPQTISKEIDHDNKINEGNFFDADGFLNRLKEATDLLESLKNIDRGEEILNGIVSALQECLNRVQDDSIKDVINEQVENYVKNNSSSEIVEKFNNYIRVMLSRFKENSVLDRTVISQRQGINFKKFDNEKSAKQFGFSVSEVRDILKLLESCFDSKGYFIRSEFEVRISQFIVYGDKIFQLLWQYLNEPLSRNDRVAFLNGLHLLISKLHQPTKILSFLLTELFRDTSKIKYSDRNAFLMASLLLRNYNKELSVDIELTPAEVLLVKNGLNEDILKYAILRLDADKILLKEKLNTIHDRLIETIDVNKSKPFTWSPHFILSLEREAFIFISLTAGELAREIIMSALFEYGDPNSTIYHLHHEEKFMLLLLQHLKLLISSMGRVGDIDDLGVLADLKKNEEKFVATYAAIRQENNVRQVFRMIDTAMGNITALQ